MERGLLINCCLGGTAAGSGRSVLQKSPSRESWLHSGCFPMKGLPSNPQVWVSSDLLPQTLSFQAGGYTTNWPRLPRRPGLLLH